MSLKSAPFRAATLVILLTAAAALSGCTDGKSSSCGVGLDTSEYPATSTIVAIETSEGCMVALLYDEKVPTTAGNFASLIRDGYYDGSKFHRIITDFMMQGGDFTRGDGTGGRAHPDYAVQGGTTIPDELPRELSHDKKGILSMANRGADTGSSQFFITFGPTFHLDGRHAVFGELIEGIEILDQIAVEVATKSGTPKRTVTFEGGSVIQEGVALNPDYEVPAPEPITYPDEDPSVREKVVLVTNLGNITIELYNDLVPNTAGNFAALAREGYYNNVPFHRIITDFMMQGGDYTAKNGSGGAAHQDYDEDGDGNIEDEFHPLLSHSGKGIVSMANRGEHTGGSQFFITFQATPWLDGMENGEPKDCSSPRVSCHAIFGHVVAGENVVDRVNQEASSANGTPGTEVTLLSTKVIPAGA